VVRPCAFSCFVAKRERQGRERREWRTKEGKREIKKREGANGMKRDGNAKVLAFASPFATRSSAVAERPRDVTSNLSLTPHGGRIRRNFVVMFGVQN